MSMVSGKKSQKKKEKPCQQKETISALERKAAGGQTVFRRRGETQPTKKEPSQDEGKK